MSPEVSRPRVEEAVPPRREWGRRLSDRIREALDAGDLDGARRLVLHGDGLARSLEKEYALMLKGLGITIRILLDLLGDTVARAAAPDRPSAERALGDLLRRFTEEMLGLVDRIYAGGPDVPAAGGDLKGELDRAATVLSEAERLFARGQALRSQEVIRAIDAADARSARALVDRKERDEYLPHHDRLIRLMADVFGYVLAHFGQSGLYRFHRETAERQRQGFEQWELLPAVEFARVTAFLLKQHMGSVEVTEDDEKFTIVQTPCGSGGRLRLVGAYSGPGALPFVEGRGPLTAGQERFPVYCSHCPIWNDVAPVEWFGRPQWVFDDPSRSDGSCTLRIEKRRDTALG